MLNKAQLTKLAIAQLANLTFANYQLLTLWSNEQVKIWEVKIQEVKIRGGQNPGSQK